jgi:hypothetical protein
MLERLPAAETERHMVKAFRRYWFLFPVIASLATQCDESPRGAVPSLIVSVQFVLESVPAPPAADGNLLEFISCLNRMDGLQNHIRPSWRANEVVLLPQVGANTFAEFFPDVPAGFQNTVTVHDINECKRDPEGFGHVTMGVFVNDTELRRVVDGSNGVFAFIVNEDGTVVQ